MSCVEAHYFILISGRFISAIFLGTLKMGPSALKSMILAIDDSLTESVVNNLMKQLPEQEIIDSLKEYKNKYEDLATAEQFLCTVSEVHTLPKK